MKDRRVEEASESPYYDMKRREEVKKKERNA
jgi:hypothetical protein